MYYAKALRPAKAAKLFFFQKNSQLPKRLKPFTELRIKALTVSSHCDGRCLYP